MFGIVRAREVSWPNKGAVQFVDGRSPVVRADWNILWVLKWGCNLVFSGHYGLTREESFEHPQDTITLRLNESSKRGSRDRRNCRFRHGGGLGTGSPLFEIVRPPPVDALKDDPTNIWVVDSTMKSGFNLAVANNDGRRRRWCGRGGKWHGVVGQSADPLSD